MHPSIHMSSVVTKATTDLAAYEKSACAMQRTWQDALVLIAAWLQVWRAWSHFKPFIVNNHTISPSLHQSFQDFLDRCRHSELR
jgi:hypothetical protein